MPSFTWPAILAWRLARQHVTEAAPAGSVEDAVRDAAGIQAQVASSAEQAAVLRTAGATPRNVRDALWERRSLVRTWAMRGTLHLLASDEYPAFVAALSTWQSWRRGAWLQRIGITTEDVERLITAIDVALTGRCLTRAELADEVATEGGPAMRDHLLSGWGGVLKPAAYLGVLCSGPNRGQNVTFVRPADWLGSVVWLDPDDGWRVVCRRFLRAYGPATHEDLAVWWGAARSSARRALALLVDELTRVDIEGRPAWALTADLDTLSASIAPRGSVVLLPGFDAYVMGACPRTSVVPGAVASMVSRTSGWISPVMLVDGVAAGVWKAQRTSSGTAILIEPFGAASAASAAMRKRIERAAHRLEAGVGPIAEVRFEEGIHG